MSEFNDFLTKLSNVFASFGFIDLLDICLVAFLVYNAIKILRETRAFQLIKGILVCVILYAVINLVDMQASTYIFNMLITNLIVIIVIIFQPEIRHTLESAGRKGLSNFSFFPKNAKADTANLKKMISEFTKACSDMSEKKIGSITVFERKTLLGEIIDTGTVIDSSPTEQLFCNVFYPKAPLHDGAVIVRNDRVHSAGCILPLTQNNDVDKELGTRHRAAIGMSEVSDAVVVVTSEETGTISVAEKGILTRGFTQQELCDFLERYIIENKDATKDKTIVSQILERFSGGDKK